MEMVTVESSNVKAIGYDPEGRRLRVQFHKQDRTYEYLDVPPEIHQAFLKAESKGSFVQRNIIKKFSGSRVS